MSKPKNPGLAWSKRRRKLNMPGRAIHGAVVTVRSVSKITGEITVQFELKAGPYVAGDRIVVKPYEVV